jgi:hypothetical protein
VWIVIAVGAPQILRSGNKTLASPRASSSSTEKFYRSTKTSEVMGFETLRAIASLADHGIAFINVKAFDTRGAPRFFAQLFEAEKRFLKVLKDAVLPLITTNGKTVKRDLLRLANETADATTQANLFPPPRPDFSMWFWVQPVLEV